MNSIDQSYPLVKGKITIVKKPKVTVAAVFPEFCEAFPIDLAGKPFDNSRELLSEITRCVAARAANEAAFETSAPTSSYVTKKQRAFAIKWWAYLTEQIVGGPEPDDKSVQRTLDVNVKQTFDAVFYKLLTNKDLPESKDGYQRNALKALREATRHGDAAIFLYRLRYWWPKAVIVIDGLKWIANTHKQWAEELGIEERSFRTAYNHLLKLNLIEARAAPFKGQTMNHVRPTEATQKLFAMLEKKLAA